MKNIFIVIILLFSSSIAFSQQKVVKESEKCNNCGTKEQQAEVRRLETELESLRKKIPRSDGRTSGTIEILKGRLTHNQRVLDYISENNLVNKCTILNEKRRAINSPGGFCDIQKYEVDRIEGANRKIQRQIAKLQDEKNLTDNFEKSENLLDQLSKKEVEKLDKESQSLEAQLKRSQQLLKKKTRKRKSLADYINKKKGSSKSSSGNNLSDLLNKKSSTSLSDRTSKKSNNLSDKLGISSSKKTDVKFEIKKRNGLTGVVDSNGKTLIPFKNWEILEYDSGIAEVKKEVNSKLICGSTIFTYKRGFVDRSGNFIDGFDISTYESQPIKLQDYGPLRIYRDNKYKWNWSLSDAENRRRERIHKMNLERKERANERKAAIKERQEEIRKKKCQIQINQYIQSEQSRYN